MVKSGKKSAWRKLYPFRSRFCKIRGLDYHYIDEGQGPPLVMLHGNPTWSFYFRNLVKTFRADHRVLVPDHIGCGLSDKPDEKQYGFRLADRVVDLATWLDGLDLEQKITLVLHDWGGMIGLVWAILNLEKVSRMVLFNTAGFHPPGGKVLPWRLRFIRNWAWIARPAVLYLNLFARAAIYMAPAKPLAPLVKQGLLAPYDRPSGRLATYRFVTDIPLEPTDRGFGLVDLVEKSLGRFEGLPILILWGNRDFVFDPDYLAAWRRYLPTAHVRVFENGGHYLLEDHPSQVIAEMKRFFNRYPA